MSTPAISNGLDPTIAKRFISEIERCDQELLSERGSYMARCKGIRERKKDWKKQAGDAGINRKALDVYLKERELDAKKAALYDVDEAEELEENVDLIRAALGDFGDSPLGAAAVEKAESRKARKSAALDDLADGANGGDPVAERIADNVTRLKLGIKPLAEDGDKPARVN